jgi:hypothetical protein
MTWGEFKALVDKTIPDDTPIWYIDISFPEGADVEVFLDDTHGVGVN